MPPRRQVAASQMTGRNGQTPGLRPKEHGAGQAEGRSVSESRQSHTINPKEKS